MGIAPTGHHWPACTDRCSRAITLDAPAQSPSDGKCVLALSHVHAVTKADLWCWCNLAELGHAKSVMFLTRVVACESHVLKYIDFHVVKPSIVCQQCDIKGRWCDKPIFRVASVVIHLRQPAGFFGKRIKTETLRAAVLSITFSHHLTPFFNFGPRSCQVRLPFQVMISPLNMFKIV